MEGKHAHCNKVDGRNRLDQIQQPFVIKKDFNTYGREGDFLNMINSVYKKLTVCKILSGERVNVFPNTGNNAGFPLLLFYSTSYWRFSQWNEPATHQNKTILIRKEELKQTGSDDMILSGEIPKEDTLMMCVGEGALQPLRLCSHSVLTPGKAACVHPNIRNTASKRPT